MPSILVAVPSYTGAPGEFLTSLFLLGSHLTAQGWKKSIVTSSHCSNIFQARSNLANLFMQRTDLDWMLWLDNDLSFRPPDFENLAIEEPLVCGHYPAKKLPPTYRTQPVPAEGGGLIQHPKHPECIEILGTGFGFVLVHRDVFLGIQKKFPELAHAPENNAIMSDGSDYRPESPQYHYFAESLTTEDGDTIFAGEDYAFFHRARAAGFKAWLNTKIDLNHVGSFVYPTGSQFVAANQPQYPPEPAPKSAVGAAPQERLKW